MGIWVVIQSPMNNPTMSRDPNSWVDPILKTIVSKGSSTMEGTELDGLQDDTGWVAQPSTRSPIVFAGTIYASEIHVYKCGSINNPSAVNALITGSSTANRLDPCVQHTGSAAVQFVVAHLCGKRRAEGARRSWCLNGVGSDSIQWAKICLLQMKLDVSLHDKAGAPASQLPFPNMLSMQSSHR